MACVCTWWLLRHVLSLKMGSHGNQRNRANTEKDDLAAAMEDEMERWWSRLWSWGSMVGTSVLKEGIAIWEGVLVLERSIQVLVHAFQRWLSSTPNERQTWREQRHQRRKARRTEKRQARQRKAARKDTLRMLAAAYRQYHLASGGSFRARRISARRSRRCLRMVSGQTTLWHLRWWLQLRMSNHLLSVADLATLWHLPEPQDLSDLSYMEPAQSRTLLVPAVLTSGQGYQIGVSSHAGHTAPVFFPVSCLRQNVLAVASTGKGKNTLFFLLAQTYLRAKVAGATDAGGFVGVDPHGDLIDL